MNTFRDLRKKKRKALRWGLYYILIKHIKQNKRKVRSVAVTGNTVIRRKQHFRRFSTRIYL